MKRAIYALAVAAMVYGCYADKSNYDFDLDNVNDFGEIEISPKPSMSDAENFGYTIKFDQPTGNDSVNYELKVRVKQTREDYSEDNLIYEWTCNYKRMVHITPDSVAVEEVKGRVERNDGTMTVTFYPFPNLGDMQSSYRLKVTDRTTGIDRYYSFSVLPRVTYENSLFVLHGNNEGQHRLGNIWVLEEADTVKTVADAYYAVLSDSVKTGLKPYENRFANTKFLAGTMNPMRNQNTPWAHIYMWAANGDNDDVYMYNPFNLGAEPEYNRNVLYPDKKLIPRWIHQPYHITGDPRLLMTDTDGRLLLSSLVGNTANSYNNNSAVCSMMVFFPGSTTAAITDPLNISEGNRDIQMAAEDQINGATALIVMYDKKFKRFLYVNTTSPYENPTPTEYRQKLGDVTANSYGTSQPVKDAYINYSVLEEDAQLTTNDKKLLYMHGGSVVDPAGIYAYFLDNQNRVYYYMLTYSGSSGKERTRAEEDYTPQYVIDGWELTEMTGVTENTPFLYWPTAAYTMIFYGDGNTLYRYNTQSNQKTLVWTAPAGWTISKLKVKTTYSPGEHNYAEPDGVYASNHIYVAMTRGEEGAVSELRLLSNGSLDYSFEPTFHDGFEKIIDLYFAYSFKKQGE